MGVELTGRNEQTWPKTIAGLLLAVAVVGALASVAVLLVLAKVRDNDSPARRDVLENAPVTFRFEDRDVPGELRVEKWVCDFESVVDDAGVEATVGECRGKVAL